MENTLRILHTADWHLGCKTDDYDRMQEQKDALNQVITIAKEKEVDMVIIAGDIYDSFVPSSDAEDLFYKTVMQLNNNGNTAVIAVAGNHDEPKRLANANVFANTFGIYMLGSLNKVNISEPELDRNIYAVDSGKGYIKFKTKAGENITLAYLPYPSYYRFKEIKKEGEVFSDKVKEWLSPGVSAFSKDTINILTSHFMTYGMNLSAEEMQAYETISTYSNSVATEVLKTGAHYTALGHVHKCLTVSKEHNIHYSGSLINQFFINNDTLTRVIVADITNEGVTKLEKIPLNVKLLKSFTVSSILHAEVVCKDNPQDLIKITIENVDRVSASEIKNLRNNYPNLITLSVITNEAKSTYDVTSKKDLTNAEIFDNFVTKKRGKVASQPVRELFLELMSEDLYEAD